MTGNDLTIESLSELNALRRKDVLKNPIDEDLLQKMNRALQALEQEQYVDLDEDFPFIFICGLPRSGTTLLAQVITHSLDVGYINNLSARFWLAPVLGIRFSHMILRESRRTTFESDYAATEVIDDIHEFGYFWRYWLKKDQILDHLQLEEVEKRIDWDGLKKTLLNMQHAFAKPVCMKNIFGSLHMKALSSHFNKVLFVYIRRDPLDNAISILNARQRFHADPNVWWSIIPQEYEQLRNLGFMQQIAGQVHYLRSFYEKQIALGHSNILVVEYKELCENPSNVINQVCQKCLVLGNQLELVQEPPRFDYRTHDNPGLKSRFKKLLDAYESK